LRRKLDNYKKKIISIGKKRGLSKKKRSKNGSKRLRRPKESLRKSRLKYVSKWLPKIRNQVNSKSKHKSKPKPIR
tara:strand:+ start:458 stop:682 length:225 start_codon:yes stop_codon:yes gene_type:complete